MDLKKYSLNWGIIIIWNYTAFIHIVPCVLTNLYSNGTTMPIKVHKVSRTPQSFLLPLFIQHHPMPTPKVTTQLLFWFLPSLINISCSRISYKWNHTLCTLLHLAASTCINSSFLFNADLVFHLWIYNNLFIHSPVHRYVIVSNLGPLWVFFFKSFCGHVFIPLELIPKMEVAES